MTTLYQGLHMLLRTSRAKLANIYRSEKLLLTETVTKMKHVLYHRHTFFRFRDN